MSDWQPGALLEPVTPENPCGESLEDTPVMASFDAFRLFGQTLPVDTPPDPKLPWKPPDWAEIRKRSLETLERSKDLRILANLSAALLRTDGIVAFGRSLVVAAHWLEHWWDETYPRLDEDAVVRRSALNCLADPMAIVDALRQVPLVGSRQHGTVTLRAIDMAAAAIRSGDKDVRFETQVAAAFGEMPLPALTELAEGLKSALASLKTMSERMASRGGAEAIPAFEPLASSLAKADRLVGAQLSARIGAVSPDGGTTVAADIGAGAVVKAVGAIASRGDAVAALDAVAEFFRRNEPASPIPLFVERAKRLVGKDFLEVLEDIAPDGLAQARSAGGLPRVE